MANEVYANGREVSCKAADGKSIAAFPDVCFTPPQTPATPPGVPIPYPNTGMASDTAAGSTIVKISGREVMLKNKSYFKKSMGDEAGSAPKKGVVSSKNMGKVYFKAWSMDVKVEGENVVRHLDLTTHNHASEGPNTAPWPYADGAAIRAGDPCKNEKNAIRENCDPESEWKKNCPPKPMQPRELHNRRAPTKQERDADPTLGTSYDTLYKMYLEDINKVRAEIDKNSCLRARRCMLVPKQQKKTDPSSPKGECCDSQTGHHVIDGASFGASSKSPNGSKPGWSKYNYNDAPCVCCEGDTQYHGSHGEVHLRTGAQCLDLLTVGEDLSAEELSKLPNDPRGRGIWSRNVATIAGARAVCKTFPKSGCSEACIRAQLDKYHDGARDDPTKPDPEIEAVAHTNMINDKDLQELARGDVR